jgi:hypothetical protein
MHWFDVPESAATVFRSTVLDRTTFPLATSG